MKRSRFEQTVEDSLKIQGEKTWYEPMKIPYVIPEKKANYIPDFVIYKGKLKKPKKPLTTKELHGTLVLEVKGYLKLEDRLKMLLVKKSNPELDIRFLFMNNGFVYKKKKGVPRRTPESTDMRYGDWCDKHGFPWAVQEIPKEWLDK